MCLLQFNKSIPVGHSLLAVGFVVLGTSKRKQQLGIGEKCLITKYWLLELFNSETLDNARMTDLKAFRNRYTLQWIDFYLIP